MTIHQAINHIVSCGYKLQGNHAAIFRPNLDERAKVQAKLDEAWKVIDDHHNKRDLEHLEELQWRLNAQ